MTTYYHSTRTELTLRDSPLSVTADYDASVEYLDGSAGRTYEVVVPAGLRLASDATVVAAARAIDATTPYRSAWECLEQVRGVRESLEAAGYDGMAIDDMTPHNRTSHRTVTIYRPVSSGVTLDGYYEQE
jgi:hypothetical protein